MIKPNFIKTVFFTSLIIASLFLLNGCGKSKDVTVNVNSNTNAMPSVVDVTTAQAAVREIPVYFESTGTLVSDAQTDVAPAVAGKIVAVNFDVGSYVTQGSVLVQLDDRDARIRLEQAQAQVAQAQSQVAQAQSQVAQAQANVRQTQAQLGLSGDATTFTVSQVPEVKTAKAALELAEKEFVRNERLLESGDVSRSIYDQKKAARDQAQAQYQTAVNSANQRYAAIGSAQAAVRAAESAVRTAQSAVEAARTQELTARKAIGDAVILAPISGYVSERVADVGEYISPSAPNSKVATIVRTSVLRLRIDVPEQSIGKVKVGQGISLQVSAYPDRNFSGIVTRILPSVNPTSRTLTVEADVQNTDGLLKPGQFATVRIAQSTSNPVVMVPVAAVKTEGDTNHVFVVKDGRAQDRIVQLGQLESDQIEIKQGVAENEQVAVTGLNQLYDGVTVRQ